ncbi:DUF397 domain-containing protein [Frankia sp. Cr2]|uniref:DUF397 domain-containing protein n=1 Tax=Frankia sp. Cr2 TaxID=3073932 RepID=UPI002AD3FEAD|nr:DUF397 domain-containing protein [Frankia sp. Cr2]
MCVEAGAFNGGVVVRDSTHPTGPVLAFSRAVGRVHRRRRERRNALLTHAPNGHGPGSLRGRAGPVDMTIPPTRSSRAGASSLHQAGHLPTDRVDRSRGPIPLTLEPQPVIVSSTEGQSLQTTRGGSSLQ